MTPQLCARGVRLARQLEPVDIDLQPGELVALIGPNGSGKTSLLRVLAGTDGTADRLDVRGEALKDVPRARIPSLLTFLPASRDVVWPISVRETIALGLSVVDDERVDQLIGDLSLKDIANRPLNQLSTGERLRALLARALAPGPRVFLLDEPLSNLDPFWVLKVLDVLGEEVRGGASALMSLHDLGQLDRFDRALLMNEGRIVADGTPAEVRNSEALGTSFGVRLQPGGWSVRPLEDPQSSR